MGESMRLELSFSNYDLDDDGPLVTHASISKLLRREKTNTLVVTTTAGQTVVYPLGKIGDIRLAVLDGAE